MYFSCSISPRWTDKFLSQHSSWSAFGAAPEPPRLRRRPPPRVRIFLQLARRPAGDAGVAVRPAAGATTQAGHAWGGQTARTYETADHASAAEEEDTVSGSIEQRQYSARFFLSKKIQSSIEIMERHK